MRKIGLVLALGASIMAVPVGAQFFSDGYEFLKAVKDRDGQVVTDALNEPGTTIVNTRDVTTGDTALHIVTERRDALWIRFLTERGANANIRNKQGVAPLQLAVTMGYAEGVDALLNAGADVEVSNVAGETPLIAAVHSRDIPIIRMLLDKGANPDRTDNSGRTARDYAALMKGSAQVMDEIEKADEKRKGKDDSANYGPTF
ncbi:ankyrin repeat domain-containing protein [Erythrobacteraceae bacterium E2-1 Yellow Sea]|nr:ankyrin repeat domain-containing protein [Erythrobacteraceae bacterium E2-1 Yellow Sea]